MISSNNITLIIIIILLIIWLVPSKKEYYDHTINTIPQTRCKMPVVKEKQVQYDPETKHCIDKFLLGSKKEICPLKPITNKQFNNNFFKFRDYTYENSSMTLDPVDKIDDLLLYGSLEQAKEFPGSKIWDVYDRLTSGPSLYEKDCNRLPKFDNTMNDGFNFKSVEGMYNTMDNWKYKDESIINGGNFNGMIKGKDSAYIPQFEYKS
jgi:hypothetical protein